MNWFEKMTKFARPYSDDEYEDDYEEENGEVITSERHNFVFKKCKPTDKLYPRRNAQITKNPL